MRRLLVLLLLASVGCHYHTKAERRAERAARIEERERVQQIEEADENMVRECRFLGTFRGTSGWGGRYGATKGQANARKEAVENAARAGATHWVDGQAASGGTSSASVKGYSCPQPSTPSAPDPVQPTEPPPSSARPTP